MQLLEWIFLSNDNTGSLVNAAEGLSPRDADYASAGGPAAGLLLRQMNQQRPMRPLTIYGYKTDGQFGRWR